MTESDKTTHFGFETVREEDKAGRVQGVFSSVASKYDIMNDVMSGGVHRIWKDAMMDWLAPRPGQRLLDVAGGTGDISFRFLKRAGSGHSTVLDITESMLVEGRKRAEAESMHDQLDWVVGDAMALPFPDNTFDVYTISFGIRNVTRPQEALNEAFRVLRPGGRLIVVSFHSLEDRCVKTFLRDHSGGAPRGSRHMPDEGETQAPCFKLLSRSGITPDADELRRNPRARSARLRAAERTSAPVHSDPKSKLGVAA